MQHLKENVVLEPTAETVNIENVTQESKPEDSQENENVSTSEKELSKESNVDSEKALLTTGK